MVKSDLVEMFGKDYYSIGLFCSVSWTDAYTYEGIIHDDVSNLCYQIKYDYYGEAANLIINLIIQCFMKNDLLSTLVEGYVPYDKDIAIEKYSVDNYLVFSTKMMELASNISKMPANSRELLIELFNMINMKYVYSIHLNIK